MPELIYFASFKKWKKSNYPRRKRKGEEKKQPVVQLDSEVYSNGLSATSDRGRDTEEPGFARQLGEHCVSEHCCDRRSPNTLALSEGAV